MYSYNLVIKWSYPIWDGSIFIINNFVINNMAINNYTSRTAALKATKIDSLSINTKTIGASSIILDGKNIKESLGFQSSEDFKKLYQRSDLNDIDTNYTLYTDGGNPVYVNDMSGNLYSKFIYQSDINSVENLDFSEATNTASMFEGCENLINFEGDLSNATDTNSMFYGCKSLKSFKTIKPFKKLDASQHFDMSYMFSGCESLSSFEGEFESPNINAHSLFAGCVLDLPSFKRIIDVVREGKLYDYTYDDGTITTIGVNSFLKNDTSLNEIIGTIYVNVENRDIGSNETDSEYSEITFADLEKDVISLDENGEKLIILEWNNYDEIIDSTFNDKTSIIENGYKLFSRNKYLSSFTASLDSLVKSTSLFESCTGLTSFSVPMRNLTNDVKSFRGCSSLIEFDSDLSSLNTAIATFESCSKLIRFASDVPLLSNADSMFRGCYKLDIFFKDLSKLVSAVSMFENCSLSTFTTPTLPLLKFGNKMFKGCKLSRESVEHIINQITTVNEIEEEIDGSGKPYTRFLTLGIDKSLTTNYDFHEMMGIEIGTTSFNVQNKNGVNWKITIEFN